MSALSFRHTPHSISFLRPGTDDELVVQQARPGHRPYLHPLHAPDGRGVLTQDSPAHHPWQHGLYIGLNDVNGTGFWMESLYESCRATDGTIHPRPLDPSEVCGDTARWTVVSEYRDAAGRPMMAEGQRWTLRAARDEYVLDFEWSLEAAIDLRFGRYDYGGLFLRMPWREDVAAGVLTSEGIAMQHEAEAQRARWVAAHMTIDGRDDPAGIAIMDHPANPGHPVTWRVDGQYGFGPNRCIAGPWELKAGERTMSRYRILPFCGTARRDLIEASYTEFTTAAGSCEGTS